MKGESERERAKDFRRDSIEFQLVRILQRNLDCNLRSSTAFSLLVGRHAVAFARETRTVRRKGPVFRISLLLRVFTLGRSSVDCVLRPTTTSAEGTASSLTSTRRSKISTKRSRNARTVELDLEGSAPQSLQSFCALCKRRQYLQDVETFVSQSRGLLSFDETAFKRFPWGE